MYKQIRKTKSKCLKHTRKTKEKRVRFFNTRGQNGPENIGLFRLLSVFRYVGVCGGWRSLCDGVCSW